MKKKKPNTDLEFERSFFEAILADNPHHIDTMIALAEVYTQIGEFKKGLILDQKISKLKPKNAISFYNLACSYSLCGQIEESFKVLKQSIKLGYDDFDHMIGDPDLENLRNHAFFNQIRTLIFQNHDKKLIKES